MNKRINIIYKIVEQLLIFSICFALGYFGSKLIKYENGKTIENRYKALDLMRFDSKSNAYVPKSDTIIITKWDLWYIQHGTTKGGY